MIESEKERKVGKGNRSRKKKMMMIKE